MMGSLRYWQLTETQRTQARAMFFDAGTGDGYWYELGKDRRVLCRHRRRHDAVDLPTQQLERRVPGARLQ